MDIELLKQLLTDPVSLLILLPSAFAIIVALKLLNILADAMLKHLSEKVRERKGLLSVCRTVGQFVSIAVILLVTSAIFWTYAVSNLLPSPTKQPISTCTATVILTIQSDVFEDANFIGQGGNAAFIKGDEVLLQASSRESGGWKRDNGVYEYRGEFTMSADSPAVGQPIDFLKQTEYVQVRFDALPSNSLLTGDKVIFVINNSIHLSFPIPQEHIVDGQVIVRDLAEGMKPLSPKQ